MKSIQNALLAALLFTVAGCSTITTSTPVAPGGEPWDGPVFVSQQHVPDRVEYEVVGSVQIEARFGYSKVEKLYPRLAEEARKIGANAVVNAQGQRRITAVSWSAPSVTGIAIKVDDQESLEGLQGEFH